MITDLAKSETKFNLMRAFAGESQARQRYGIAAAFAADEKLYIIQDAFLFTADQEQEHGEIFYDFLKPFAGRNLRVDADYPVDLFNTTLEFLRKAQENEMDEFNSIYRKFGEVAKEEGFEDIAEKFFSIAKIEKTHSERFKKFADLIEKNELFESKVPTKWLCLKCGNVYTGRSVPDYCPVCHHDRGYYLKNENFLITQD